MDNSEKITYTKESIERLRKRYEEAIAGGDDRFTFEGNEYMIDYAKYMLEYLEGVFFNDR